MRSCLTTWSSWRASSALTSTLVVQPSPGKSDELMPSTNDEEPRSVQHLRQHVLSSANLRVELVRRIHPRISVAPEAFLCTCHSRHDLLKLPFTDDEQVPSLAALSSPRAADPNTNATRSRSPRGASPSPKMSMSPREISIARGATILYIGHQQRGKDLQRPALWPVAPPRRRSSGSA